MWTTLGRSDSGARSALSTASTFPAVLASSIVHPPGAAPAATTYLMYLLIYLKYWTLILRPLMVYPKVVTQGAQPWEARWEVAQSLSGESLARTALGEVLESIFSPSGIWEPIWLRTGRGQQIWVRPVLHLCREIEATTL